VKVPDGSSDTHFYEIRLFPAAKGEFWAAYQFHRREPSYSALRLSIAKISPAQGQVLLNRPIASTGYLVELGFTPAGNLKLLVGGPGWTEETTEGAPLVAACPDTAYFLILSPSGQTLYASYVVSTEFDFTNGNEPKAPAPARVGCFASTAGRFPAAGAAPGQLITITGGGFGPTSPIYYTPDANGKYPLTAGGFRVRISGRDAPMVAIARGIIAVQVPYETGISFETGTIEVFENGMPLNTIPIRHVANVFGLFDTGDRNNSFNLPALAALNQDGTINSRDNPARVGSIVSLFGSGAGLLSPALESGGLSPIPPAAPLSESSLYRACRGCEILYLGSAPGLSTSVVQVNVRIVSEEPGTGVRPHGIGIGVAPSPRGLLAPLPASVVFIE
jgi:uncharacterized protein (TIGR03437 family)